MEQHPTATTGQQAPEQRPGRQRSGERWAWRTRLRENPRTRQPYRIAVGVVGAAIILLGLLLLPFPGPGWLVIFAGLGVLATEFEWAKRLLAYAKRRVSEWTDWTKRQNLLVRALVVFALVAVVLAVFWLLFLVSGVPDWLPDLVQDPVQTYVPGL